MLPIALALVAVLTVWAMYKAIVYALPCLVGLGGASLALSSGAGWGSAALVGLGVAASTFYILRFLIANVRSRTARWAVAAALAIPSAVLAYNVAIDALTSSAPTELWRQALSIGFALVASATAFARLTEPEARDP